MGRHQVSGTDLDPDEWGPWAAAASRLARLGLVAAAVVVVVGATVVLLPKDALAGLPWLEGRPCPRQPVDLLVEPELQPVVESVLRPVQGEALSDGSCLTATVHAQQAVETVASSGILPSERAPDVWIPDSTAWTGKISTDTWKLERVEPLASSPVVVATSKSVAQKFGWLKEAPTWDKALRGERPMAVPDIQTQADSLAALIALWQTLGKGPQADQAVVNVVLAADRGEVPTADAAFAIARSGSVMSPVIPATEQAVAASNQLTGTDNLVAVYPAEGAPVLDYPVMQVRAQPRSPGLEDGVRTVLRALRSPEARSEVARAGFRGPGGEQPQGVGIRSGPVPTLQAPGTAEVDAMLGRITNLARPSRILAVVDVSTSMEAKLDDGVTRIGLAGAAARLGVDLLPDRSSVGAWAFAHDMDGGQDWKELSPVMPLGQAEKSGEPHRSVLKRVASNINQYLTPGGTSLYDVAVASARRMHETYDPRAVNAIILMSDGSNEADSRTTLDGVVKELRRLNAGDRKVAIYTAGLGPDADYAALRRIAEASGGYSYRIDTAAQGQTALLDGLRRSRRLGS